MIHTPNTFGEFDKGTIRKKYKQKRLSLDKKQIAQYSKMISKRLIDTLIKKYKNIDEKKIALYFSANNEVDTTYLIHDIIKNHPKITLLMPKIQDNILCFNHYSNTANRVKNQVYKTIEEIDSQKFEIPDIIVSPLVAFDEKGNRIGMGGGFYDRTLKQLRKKHHIHFISLAYEIQKYHNIISEMHDQKLDIIVTEKRTYSS